MCAGEVGLRGEYGRVGGDGNRQREAEALGVDHFYFGREGERFGRGELHKHEALLLGDSDQTAL